MFDRSGLSTRYVASASAAISVPLPMAVSIYRRVGSASETDKIEVLALSARMACTELLEAVRLRRKSIALVGSPKAMLSTILKTALASTNFELTRHENVGSWGRLISDLTLQSKNADGDSPDQFLVVINDAYLLLPSAHQSLIEAFDNPKNTLVQAILVGGPELEGQSTLERKAFSGLQATVTLEPEQASDQPASSRSDQPASSRSELEEDLARSWYNSRASKWKGESPPEQEQLTISPYPGLAAFLDQEPPARQRMRARLKAGFVIAALCCSVVAGLLVAYSF